LRAFWIISEKPFLIISNFYPSYYGNVWGGTAAPRELNRFWLAAMRPFQLQPIYQPPFAHPHTLFH